MLRNDTILTLHLNLDAAHLSNTTWHADQRWLAHNPRVLVNPTRIAVSRQHGGSILAAHLLNVRWLLQRAAASADADGEQPAYLMLMASNQWLLRGGVEDFIRCHTSR